MYVPEGQMLSSIRPVAVTRINISHKMHTGGTENEIRFVLCHLSVEIQFFFNHILLLVSHVLYPYTTLVKNMDD